MSLEERWEVIVRRTAAWLRWWLKEASLPLVLDSVTGRTAKQTGFASAVSRVVWGVTAVAAAAVHSEAVGVMGDRSGRAAGPLAPESCRSKGFVTLRCCCLRLSCHFPVVPQAPPPDLRSLRLDVSVGVYIGGYAGHIDCTGTSCRTWSSFWHSCCMQSGFSQRTWVLCLHWVEVPLGCSGLVRGRCNGAGADPCRLSGQLQMILILSLDSRHGELQYR
jgi:hypothetical protein